MSGWASSILVTSLLHCHDMLPSVLLGISSSQTSSHAERRLVQVTQPVHTARLLHAQSMQPQPATAIQQDDLDEVLLPPCLDVALVLPGNPACHARGIGADQPKLSACSRAACLSRWGAWWAQAV